MSDSTVTPWIFEIREEKFGKLVDQFTKMVNRARKCKLAAPRFEVIHEADAQVTRLVPDRQLDPTGQLGMTTEITEWVHYLYVVVEGDRPHLSGWDFIATVDHTDAEDGVGNIIKSVPGAGEIPVAYRNAFPVCDHCRTARNRNETFILRNQNDPSVTQQVGRNCLQDFFPGESPQEIAQLLSWWTEATEMLGACGDEDEFYGGSHPHTRYGVVGLLQGTQAAIDAFGWTSRTKARETEDTATADQVALLWKKESDLSTQNKLDVKKIRAHYNEEKNAPGIEAALAWIRGIDPTTVEDYLYNLHTVCRGECVREDRLGLACSLLPAYRRFLEGERQKQETAQNPSEYVGVVGERSLFEGCVLKYVSEPYASDWGTTTRLTFHQGPNVLIWWASNPEGFETDKVYAIVASVKKHENYCNLKRNTVTKQTIVNRVSVATDKDRKKFAKKMAAI